MPRTTIGLAEVGLYIAAATTPLTSWYEVNCFNMRDPIGREDLKKLTGADPAVKEFVRADPKLPAIISHCHMLVHDAVKKQGLNYISITFRDHHGKWISRAVGELVADHLDKEGYKVNVLDYANGQL